MPVGFAQRSGLANSSAPKAMVETPRTRDRTGMGALLARGRSAHARPALQPDGETLRNGSSQGIRNVGPHRFDPGSAEDDVAREAVPAQGAAAPSSARPAMMKRATGTPAARARRAKSADSFAGTQRSPRPCRIATVRPRRWATGSPGRRPRGEPADGGDLRVAAGAQGGPAAHRVPDEDDRHARGPCSSRIRSIAQRTSV